MCLFSSETMFAIYCTGNVLGSQWLASMIFKVTSATFNGLKLHYYNALIILVNWFKTNVSLILTPSKFSDLTSM
jgi:hypothetical protein